jgi:hypothetical protein
MDMMVSRSDNLVHAPVSKTIVACFSIVILNLIFRDALLRLDTLAHKSMFAF